MESLSWKRDLVDGELAKNDWLSLRSFKGDAASLPSAVRALVFAETEESAAKAYWRIDNTALVQGRLSESVAPLVSCLVVGLKVASPFGRNRILDLLATIAGGYDDHVDTDSVGPVSVSDCVHRMVGLFPLFVEELQGTGNPSCVDILLMCGIYEEPLRGDVEEVFQNALTLHSCVKIRDLIEVSLQDLVDAD